jgi:benzoate membrane transport protein
LKSRVATRFGGEMGENMRASVIISALVAVLVGFGGSVAIILSAARAVEASAVETSSWVSALCFAIAGITTFLSIRHRLPIVAAWSTPGAALIAASVGVSMGAAVGAFFLAAVLLLLTAAIRPLSVLTEKIPTAIGSAMLAGVLFEFVVAVWGFLQTEWLLVLPLLVGFTILRLFSASWAVLAVLLIGVALAHVLGMTSPVGALQISSLAWVAPVFEPAALVGLGIPLYLVTMASQNLPGFAVLRAAGYPVPSRSILGVSGLASLLTAGAGAHSTNLAAITASICTGPDAHPDQDKRWLCGPVYALFYLVLGIFGASVVTLFASFPEALIVTIAGVALTGPLVGALSSALAEADDRFAAVMTFVVTASGLTAFGIGSAFWGLTVGLIVYGLQRSLGRSAK